MLRQQLAAATAVVRRDAQMALSYRFNVVAQLLSAIFSLTLFYYLSRLVRVSAFRTSDAYYAFVVVGLVILQVLNSTLQTPPDSVRQEMVAGTFERMVLSPFGPVASLLSMLAFPLLDAMLTGAVMLGFAWLAFGMPLRWSTAALAVPVSVLGALSFAPFGLLLMSVVMVLKQAAHGTTWIIAGISLVSGLYFPIALLPGAVRWLADVQPFTPAVELLRSVLVGTPMRHGVVDALVKMAVSAVVLLPVSTAALRAAIDVSRRRGTVVEY